MHMYDVFVFLFSAAAAEEFYFRIKFLATEILHMANI